MIKYSTYEEDKGRLYAIVTRDTPSRDDKIDIVIRNADDEYTHTKYLPNAGTEVSIDLTPYCKAYMTGKLSDVLQVAGPVDAWNLNIGVRGGVKGNYLYDFSGYPSQRGILTKLPYLQVSRDNNGRADSIYLGVIASDDMEGFIDSDTSSIPLLKDERLQFCSISGDTKQLRMYDKEDNYKESEFINPRITVRTVPRGMNTRRLIWRNELGGIDAWSFEFLRESTFATTSEVFYSALNGYTRTNRQYERVNIVETRELDDITANVLAYITASPEVYLWDYEKNTAIPVDVITEECRTYSDTELTSIQIAYRPKEREVL